MIAVIDNVIVQGTPDEIMVLIRKSQEKIQPSYMGPGGLMPQKPYDWLKHQDRPTEEQDHTPKHIIVPEGVTRMPKRQRRRDFPEHKGTQEIRKTAGFLGMPVESKGLRKANKATCQVVSVWEVDKKDLNKQTFAGRHETIGEAARAINAGYSTAVRVLREKCIVENPEGKLFRLIASV